MWKQEKYGQCSSNLFTDFIVIDKVDEIIDFTLGKEAPLFNGYFMHTMLPLGSIPLLTYANNNMVLTGSLH